MRGKRILSSPEKRKKALSAILNVENLTYIYSAQTPFERKALDSVSLAVEEGELLGIIGHTGSGKSTLIQHLNGLLRPTAGKIMLRGKDIWAQSGEIRQVRFKVGLVFQYPEYQLFEETVYKDIAFGPKNMGLDAGQIKQRVEQAMEFVGLSESFAQSSPFELSGGEKRRVAIAGVIAMEPDVLILDEPTAGLDPSGCDSLLRRIGAYHENAKATVILVSHSMEDIAKMAERIVVMNEAKIAMTGTRREIFSRAHQLEEFGLDVPQVTRVMMRLHEMGLDVDPSAYTVEDAARQLLRMKGGGK